MNRLPLYLFLLFTTVAITTNPVMADDSIEILSPPDMASVGDKLINIVCRINKDSLDSIRVTSDYTKAMPLPEPVAKVNIRHTSLLLREGENRIRIKGLQAGNDVEDKEKVLTVFLRSKLIGDYNRTPPGFTDYIFHTPDNEKNCSICHAEELSKGARSQIDNSRPSCYTCHKRKVESKYVHGPTAVWACDTCHTENSAQRKNGVPKPEVMVCRECHSAELDAWQSEKFGHGPTMAGECAICHNPHASDENFFLRMATSDLCGNCHRDKLLYPHVISGNSGTGHPVNKKTNKYVKGGRITCASCHNPHAEDNQYLLVGYTGDRMKFCRNCHR